MNTIELNEEPDVGREPQPGDFYLLREDRQVYVLGRTDHGRYQLTELSEGGYWANPSESIRGAFGGEIDDFTRVTQPFTITPGA